MRDPAEEALKRKLGVSTHEGGDGIGLAHTEVGDWTPRARPIGIGEIQTPRKWWPALVFVGTLGLVSVLLFARVGATDIELDLSVTSPSFDLATEQVLTGAIRLASLGASGLSVAQMPEALRTSLPPGVINALLLRCVNSADRGGTLTLGPILLPSETRITLLRSDVPRQYRLSLAPSQIQLKVALEGRIDLMLAGSPPRQAEFATPKAVTLEGRPEEMTLDLTFPQLPQTPLSRGLSVRNLSFLETEDFPTSDHTLVRSLSTIVSGTLYFESLNGREKRLRPGEWLRFHRSEGWIRILELKDDAASLKFHGRVSGMITGTGEGMRSLMPTYLEWLQARHGLSLFWGTSLYLFGLISAALRWWKGRT